MTVTSERYCIRCGGNYLRGEDAHGYGSALTCMLCGRQPPAPDWQPMAYTFVIAAFTARRAGKRTDRKLHRLQDRHRPQGDPLHYPVTNAAMTNAARPATGRGRQG